MGTILVPANQRRTMRRAARVDCQVVRAHDFKLLGDWTLDVSPDGLLLVSNVPVLTGEELVVSLRAPRSGAYVDTEATVARVVHGRRPSDRHRRALGVEFTSLDEDGRRVLRNALAGLPPPLPSRRRRIDYAASVHLAALE
jgi:hypothetical protein